MGGGVRQTSAVSVRNAERRAEMLRLRAEGLTLEEIGSRMGVSRTTVHKVIGLALEKLVSEPAQELMALELARLDLLFGEAMRTATAFHPLVSAGSVVIAPVLDQQGQSMRDVETGEVLTAAVEDKAPKLAAIAACVRVMERRAKLLGLDATPLQRLHVVNEGSESNFDHLTVADLEQIKAKLYSTDTPVPVPDKDEEVTK